MRFPEVSKAFAVFTLLAWAILSLGDRPLPKSAINLAPSWSTANPLSARTLTSDHQLAGTVVSDSDAPSLLPADAWTEEGPGGLSVAAEPTGAMTAYLDPANAGQYDHFGDMHGFPRPRGGSTGDPAGWSDETLSPTSPGMAGTVPGAGSSAFATGGFPITIPPLSRR